MWLVNLSWSRASCRRWPSNGMAWHWRGKAGLGGIDMTWRRGRMRWRSRARVTHPRRSHPFENNLKILVNLSSPWFFFFFLNPTRVKVPGCQLRLLVLRRWLVFWNSFFFSPPFMIYYSLRRGVYHTHQATHSPLSLHNEENKPWAGFQSKV